MTMDFTLNQSSVTSLPFQSGSGSGSGLLLQQYPSNHSDAPPGSPIDRNNQLKHGNWFETQLVLSLAIGLFAFLTFCYSRARSTLTFAPRTHLSAFSPHPVHLSPGFLSWIIPTLKTSEDTVLQIVGFDAVVLLYFFKLGFYYFLTCTLVAFAILVPINIRENGTTEGVPPDRPIEPEIHFRSLSLSDRFSSWPKLTENVNLYHISHLLFTYFFSLLLLRSLKITYLRFIVAKPIFCLAHANSVPPRTLLIENLPLHLQNDDSLYEYFNDLLQFEVEAVNVVRDVSGLVGLLERRTKALMALEKAWTQWLGNPVQQSATTGYSPLDELERILPQPVRGQPPRPIPPPLTSTRDRPTFRPSWFSLQKIDLIDHLTTEFREADDLVKRRRMGKFRCAPIAFVTFKNLEDAQILAQVIHWPKPGQALVSLAPEPRDIYWPNVAITPASHKIRNALVLVCMALLYGFWATPVTFLAKWMSYDTLVSLLNPGLVKLIEKSPTIKALIQNSLPTLAIIIFNALLPFMLDWLCTIQGFKAKSLIEYSLMKKYHLFLLITVLLIFVAVSTVSLLLDLRNNPGQLIDKIASSLPGARNFFISYLMLQSLAIIPLQLLQLPSQFSRAFHSFFGGLTTPRNRSEMKNMHLEVLSLGTIYPQALLVFTIGITYSVIAPTVLVFGTIYFGMAYLVYKYKVLNVYYRAFESQGQAWPIACNRIGWGLIIFQVFMLGLLSLQQVFLLSTLVVPLLLYTIFQLVKLDSVYGKHATFTPLSQIREAQEQERDEEQGHGGEMGQEVGAQGAKSGDRARKSSVTMSQKNLNVKRYSQMNEALYIGGQDEYTDNREPPMSSVFTGVLDTGLNGYAHPAIVGRIPMPQLPVVRSETDGQPDNGQANRRSLSAERIGGLTKIRQALRRAKGQEENELLLGGEEMNGLGEGSEGRQQRIGGERVGQNAKGKNKEHLGSSV